MYTGYIGIDRVETGESPFLLYFTLFRYIMKKNIKKQLNKKTKKLPKIKAKASVKAKKSVLKKTSSKSVVSAKTKKTSKSKTKAALKKSLKVTLRQKAKKIIRKNSIKRTGNQTNYILTFGDIEPGQGKILLLILAILLALSILIVQSMAKANEKVEQPRVAGVAVTRNIVREKEINDLVQGYPIEKMTRYIAKQDPKVAAFLIAIAKKESSWGERKPILNGEDCYNYWGFRLKSDRMGSGGHTCFDSPEEAVEIVGSRLNHLVNEEKIDTPKEMVIWKCGYSCDGPEAAGSEKWIKDVDYYYRQMIN